MTEQKGEKRAKLRPTRLAHARLAHARLATAGIWFAEANANANAGSDGLNFAKSEIFIY